MTNIIASRSAGAKLLIIVAILTIPLLVLSYLMLGSVRHDIKFAKSELAGVKLIEATVPLLLNSANDPTYASDIKNLTSVMETIDAELADADEAADLQEVAKETIAALTSETVDRYDALQQIEELLHTIGSETGLILDPFEQTYFLAQTAAVTLPGVVVAYHSADAELKKDAADYQISPIEVMNYAKKIGQLELATGFAKDTVEHIFEGYGSDVSFANFNSFLSYVDQDTVLHAKALSPGKSFDLNSAITSMSKIARENNQIAEQASAAFNDVTTHLKSELSQRVRDLTRKLYILLTVAGFCLLAAVGSALSMFKSTLKKLDLVEAAKLDAEKMTSQLTTMNDDMVLLNQDLSINMKKLKDAQDDLVKKGRMEQLGQLTATIAHELRNPLGAVRTSSFLLERKIKGKGLDVEKQFERINNGIVRCDNIITQLLDYSRTKQLTKKSTDFDQWLVNVVEETAKALPLSIELECMLGLDGKHVAFDASRMERAIINLVNNASEAMVGNGSENLIAGGGKSKITVSTGQIGGNVHVMVRDTGPGISAENLLRIREPLFTTKSFGTGLGIPAIEQIATQHGGELQIESVVGEGATFTLIIPTSTGETLEKDAA